MEKKENKAERRKSADPELSTQQHKQFQVAHEKLKELLEAEKIAESPDLADEGHEAMREKNCLNSEEQRHKTRNVPCHRRSKQRRSRVFR